MKAKQFIQVALIDQMQQIADLGLWFHLAKLMPPGVEVLARVWYCNDEWWKVLHEMARGYDAELTAVNRFYKDVFPGGYHHYPQHTGFYSEDPHLWIASDPKFVDKHLQFKTVERFVKYSNLSDEGFTTKHSEGIIYVPQWFEDFKSACRKVIAGIDAGELQDIEIIKNLK